MILWSKWFSLIAALSKFDAKVTVLSSPGNIKRQLILCKDQRPEDAVADFLLRHGVHDDNFQPIRNEFEYLLRQLQANMSDSINMERSVHTHGDTSNELYLGSPFINSDNRFITLYLGDKPDDTIHSEENSLKYPVYLRVGYSGTDQANCVCSQIGCSEFEFTAIEDYITSTLRAMSV